MSMMNPEIFNRTGLLIGNDNLEKLNNSGVIVFGIGGVGGYAAEALVRSGVGRLAFVDGDRVSETNLNRQIVAFKSTLGMNKAEVMKRRALDINPDADVTAYDLFYDESTEDLIDLSCWDHIIDAIDSVGSKLLLIENAQKAGVPIISCMGAGNKTDPTAFKAADIYKTSMCPLARTMRRELKIRGIEKLKAVYSTEPARSFNGQIGSLATVVSAAGMLLAHEVLMELTGRR